MVLYGLFNALENFGIIKNDSYGRFRVLVLVSLISTVPTLLLGWYKAAFFMYAILILGMLVVEVVFPLVYGKDKKTWAEKRTVAERLGRKNRLSEESKSEENFLSKKLFVKLKPFPGEFLIALAPFIWVSTVAGFSFAKFETRHYVLDTIPSTVLVAKYDDSLFVVPFDENTLVFSPNLKILDRSYILENRIGMTYKKIGQLKQPDILKDNNGIF